MKETKNLRDKQLVCQDYQLPFTWTAGEQELFHSKQLSEPKRYPECRRQRKENLVKAARYD